MCIMNISISVAFVVHGKAAHDLVEFTLHIGDVKQIGTCSPSIIIGSWIIEIEI